MYAVIKIIMVMVCKFTIGPLTRRISNPDTTGWKFYGPGLLSFKVKRVNVGRQDVDKILTECVEIFRD